MGWRRRGEAHEIAGADLVGGVTDFGDAATGEHKEKLLVGVVVVKLGALRSRLEPDEMHAYALERGLRAQVAGVTHRVGVELVLVASLCQCVDVGTSKVVVLVTDGVNNAGQIGPQAAAEAARALEVKVYTVGVGSEGPVPIPVDMGPMGSRTILQEVELDEELLQEIAQTTQGQYFRATDPEGLATVFRRIDELEKTEIESQVRVLYSELFPLTLFPALMLLMLERLLVSTRLRRLP